MGKEGLIEAIRNYQPDWSWCNGLPQYGMDSNIGVRNVVDMWNEMFRWQYQKITDDVFVPVCYQLGHCPFQADFDRGCTIRPRVESFAAKGVPSERWETSEIHPIKREEWLADPKAGWVA
jgi:hypothetical protein